MCKIERFMQLEVINIHTCLILFLCSCKSPSTSSPKSESPPTKSNSNSINKNSSSTSLLIPDKTTPKTYPNNPHKNYTLTLTILSSETNSQILTPSSPMIHKIISPLTLTDPFLYPTLIKIFTLKSLKIHFQMNWANKLPSSNNSKSTKKRKNWLSNSKL